MKPPPPPPPPQLHTVSKARLSPPTRDRADFSPPTRDRAEHVFIPQDKQPLSWSEYTNVIGRPCSKDKMQLADHAHKAFHLGNVGDHLAGL